MNRLDELERQLRKEASDWQPSPELETRLLKEWGQGFRPAAGLLPGVFRPRNQFLIAAIAATLLFALWPKPKTELKSQPKPKPMIARVTGPAPAPIIETALIKPKRRRKPAKPEDPGPHFVRIPYSAPLASWERAEIVRVEMPISALAAAGLHVAIADTSARAQADLMIGEDGMARAVRLISVVSN